MKTFITGLDEIDSMINNAESDQPRVKWLKIEDGQSVKIRFANELTDVSPHFDPERGLVVAVWEHSNPDDFRRKAACTLDSEGRCFGCEQNAKGKKGWYRKARAYVSVLVDNGIEEPYGAVWSMGVKRSPVFELLREYVGDTGSISNLTWRLKRSGVGSDTVYTLLPTAPDATPFDWSRFEIPNPEDAVRQIEYDKQQEFYVAVKNVSKPSEEVAETSIPW